MTGDGCLNYYVPLMNGFEVSPFSNDILENVVRVHGWGTNRLMMLTGGMFYTKRAQVHMVTILDYDSYNIETSGNQYRVPACNSDILIRMPCSNLHCVHYSNLFISTTN